MTISTTRLQHIAPENAIRFIGHDTHSHDAPHLIHVATGSAHLVVDGTQMTLRARESAWLAPHVPHSARYESGSLVLGPLLSPRSTPPTRVLRLGEVPQISAVMTTILGVAPHTPDQVEPLRQALGTVLAELATVHFPQTAPKHPVAATIARAALRSDATLDELAAEHGTSARHMQRVFLAETGVSFARWRVRARLNAAIVRLRGGDRVELVAATVGYRTRSGLVKALRREVDAGLVRELLGDGSAQEQRPQRDRSALTRR